MLLFRISIVQLVVRFLFLRDLSVLTINPYYQGIYPTAVFVMVTMRMSAADILSQPGRDTHHYPSTTIFSPPSPTAQPPILVITDESSSDSDSFVGLQEDRSNKILASSDPEKGGKIV